MNERMSGDESADARGGDVLVGGSRQYNGRGDGETIARCRRLGFQQHRGIAGLHQLYTLTG